MDGNIEMPLKLKGSSSGDVTLDVPAAAGTNTLTLPARTGNIITSADTGTVTEAMLASGAVTNQKLGSGLVLKVQHFSNGGSSTTSTSAVNANTSNFSYTPVSTNSTLIIIASATSLITAGGAGINSEIVQQIYEGASALGTSHTVGVTSGSGTNFQSSASFAAAVSLTNTSTSARTFSLYHRVQVSSGGSATATSADIRFTILEVAN